MSKNLRVFFLSLLAVIFAVSCAFSAEVEITSNLEITETDDEALRTQDDDCIEGYVFTTRLELTGDFEYETSRGTKTVEYDEYTVDSWSVTEANGKDISWLKTYKISDDRVLILEGKLPAYSTENDFVIEVSANVSYTSDAGTKYEAKPDEPAEVEFSVGEDEAAATIEPALNYSDDTTVFFSSYDVSPYVVSKDYEAYLVMPYNDEVGSAYIYEDEFGPDGDQRVLLPAWLSYDIASTEVFEIDGEERTVITSLHFFYNDEVDYTPDEGAESSVHIIGVDTDDDWDHETTISWDVKIGTAIKHIKLLEDEAEIELDYGETASVDLEYEGLTPVKFVLTDSTDTEISGDVLGLTVTSNDTKIFLTVAPTKSGKYSGTITFTDSKGGTDTATLSVDVTPVITISEDKVEISAAVGSTSSATINIKGADLASYSISPNVPASFDLTSADTSTTITLTITPSAPADDYTGTLTVYDAYGHSDDVSVTLKATSTGKFTIDPTSTTAKVEQGNYTTVRFTASNVPSGATVTWIGKATSGTGLTVTFDPTGTTAATTTTATITASDSATSGTISLYASAGGQTSETATITVTVTEPEPGPGPEPEEPEEIDVDELDSKTQAEVAKIAALRAGGSTSATISVASILSSLGTPVDAESWVLYIGSRAFYVSSSSVNSTASDWTASLTDATTDSVKVNITAPDTVTEATDISLGFETEGTLEPGNAYEIPLATIPASGSTPRLRSSSSSGCSAGFGALALLFAVPMFIRRKRS